MMQEQDCAVNYVGRFEDNQDKCIGHRHCVVCTREIKQTCQSIDCKDCQRQHNSRDVHIEMSRITARRILNCLNEFGECDLVYAKRLIESALREVETK
jgi:hypothetical protein